mgnify:CR=1 FL=1
MAYDDYLKAQKLALKAYKSKTLQGSYPYLPVLDEILSHVHIEREENLGTINIPAKQVIGTSSAGRTQAFACNFMPLLNYGSEFSVKWSLLYDAQIQEGIHTPIKVYEFLNKYYVVEGNKRTSVLKYVGSPTIPAEVIRKVPRLTDDPDIQIYYEFMEFYKCTRLNDIYFSEVGSFPSLMKLVGIEPDKKMDEDAKKDFVSCFLSFKNAFDSRGGDRFDYPVGDAFLRFIHIFGYDTVKKMTPSDMAKNVAKSWAEFVLLSEDSAVDLKMDPTVNEPKKNILSYLLPRPDSGSNKLKVGFIYENTPQDSEWCYAHELGRQYIDDTFGKQIETISITNVKPEKDDEHAIEMMIKNGADLIFVTSPAMTIASVKMAIAHPDVKILNCSLNTSHKYIRTYYARMYEAKFLTGVLAGALATQNKIGYVAQYPVYGTVANINAFALGAKFVNPRARIYLKWSSVKGINIEEEFKKEDIHYISDQDMITPQCGSRRFGLYNNEGVGNRQHIAMPVWHWGVFYEKLIQSILSGSWKKDEDSDSGRALNYWWGMSSGVVDLICSNKVPVETRRLVELFRKVICNNEFEPFSDELYDQNRHLQNKKGHEMSPEDIITMDWLLDNVVGDIPAIDELDESARAIMVSQGITRE